jgi:hypothetical protein
MIGEAADRARMYHSLGEPMETAVEKAVAEELSRRVSGATSATPGVVLKAHTIISPWLWIFSLVGFGMALINTRRISKIYGGWRAARRSSS